MQQIIAESGYFGLFERLIRRTQRAGRQSLLHAHARWKGSYSPPVSTRRLQNIISTGSWSAPGDIYQGQPDIIHHYLVHRFDLLGSGWMRVGYGISCPGLENHRYDMGRELAIDQQGRWLCGRINSANLARAQQIWQHITPDYQPIDWQLDFKSGYRWSERIWSKKIRFGHLPGVDVKVPWELARMQHLPQLAWASLSPAFNAEEKERIVRDYGNQVLDFIATNPPGFGVNWVCSMDIAIRAVNWLLARDIFLLAEHPFSDYFEATLAQSIYEHGLHIINNLEWDAHRANHYLANIAGLAFISAYLPSDDVTDAWLAFAVQELIEEVSRQFHADGGNFEGSTAYHRLSAEMVYYASALILGLPPARLEKLKTYSQGNLKSKVGGPSLRSAPLPFYPLPDKTGTSPFPLAYLQGMERMAEFIMDITKPDGHIPQIGDNDSGRFCKLESIYRTMTVREAKATYANLSDYADQDEERAYFMEDHLDCSHLVAAAYGIFDRTDFAAWLGGERAALKRVDALLIRALLRDIDRAALRQNDFREDFSGVMGQEALAFEVLQHRQASRAFVTTKTEFTVAAADLLEGLTCRVYPDFGVYLLRSPRLYLMIRCWVGEQVEVSSHRHQDQLSLELALDGNTLITDPGTYLYTPLPSQRADYRCAHHHFSPFNHSDSGDFHQSHVFSTLRPEPVDVLYFGKNGFMAESRQENETMLAVRLGNQSVMIYHVAQKRTLGSRQVEQELSFSPGYGIKLQQGVTPK